MKQEKRIIISKATTNKISRLNREQFKAFLNDPVRNQLVDDYRQETDPEKKEEKKRNLPGPIWGADDFTDDIRHDKSIVLSNLYLTDYDAKANPHMGDAREYFLKYFAGQLDALHMLGVSISVSENGLHTVALRPLNATIAQAQEWQGKMVGLKPDPACTNPSRLEFASKATDYLHIDLQAMFGEKETEPYTIPLSDSETATASQASNSPISQEKIDEVRSKKYYDIEFGRIFDTYVGTEKIPEGQRNNLVFSKGHKLMALGLSTDELVAAFTPITDLSQEELRQALRWQSNYVPGDGKLPAELRRIIRQLREEAGLETGTGMIPCRPLPKKLPPLIRILAAVAPKGMAIPLIILVLPFLGFLGTKVRLRYLDGVIHFLAFMAHVVGKFAGGKSTLIKWLTNHLLEGIRERDEVARQQEREYAEMCRKCKADERKPDDPKPVIRYIPFTISVAQLLKRLDQAKGQHLLSVCDEVDTVLKTNKGGAWTEKTDIYRQAFDGGEYGQDYLSDNSYSGIFQVLYNTASGGTDASTNKYFGKHVLDGYVSRVAFTRIPDEFGGDIPKFKTLTAKQEAEIEQGIRMLEEAEGEIKLPRTLKAIEQWLVEKRQLAIETMSSAIDALYKRSAVMGFRAGGIAYVLCGGKETKEVVDFTLFVADYILQQQVALWGNVFEAEAESTTVCSLANLYQELPEEFTREELVNLRAVNGQGTNVNTILYRWKKAGMIRELETSRRYIRTQA